ncbi:hypothetical protein [Novosphingobium terrae]|uniref:hypothetical protein n=1 Tax=Novosphingobium terrae TaxID=2726189 RepID=UPI00197E6B35|nr:hypothetical protein [Novosphingobium terrae]
MRVKIVLGALALLLPLGACHKEKSFDERYQQQSEDAQNAASKMEKDLHDRLRAAQVAGNGTTEQQVQKEATSNQ